MDISSSTAPRTDQQNFDNYLAGPKTVTISEVKAGTAEQPIEIHLVEFPGQPYKPSKSMRRVLVASWGAEASVYAGRRMTLFGDPTVRFGSAVVGGIKISHLSHIDKPLKTALTVSRGKREQFTVTPLTAVEYPHGETTPTHDYIDPTIITEWVDAINATTTLPGLQAVWEDASKAGVTRSPQIIAAKDARKKALL